MALARRSASPQRVSCRLRSSLKVPRQAVGDDPTGVEGRRSRPCPSERDGGGRGRSRRSAFPPFPRQELAPRTEGVPRRAGVVHRIPAPRSAPVPCPSGVGPRSLSLPRLHLSPGMSKTLVIVESPTKAKTLKKFLGSDYVVESSIGHVRDLPANAAEVPAEFKKEAWARLGVDVAHDFKPLYIVQPDKKKKIAELKAALKGVDALLLATDEDREGEAISWHLVEVLKPKVPYRRMVFHEITKAAILEAVKATRDIDTALVEAQEGRRIIDRLYGYEVSPVLGNRCLKEGNPDLEVR
jgi:hypothetical protein